MPNSVSRDPGATMTLVLSEIVAPVALAIASFLASGVTRIVRLFARG